jgi:hypothetical protein
MNALNEYNELRTGDIVGDTNRMVLLCTKLTSRQIDDSYANWVAICHKDDQYHPYAVWRIVAKPNGFVAYDGEYFSNIEYAIKSYERRGGKSIL